MDISQAVFNQWKTLDTPTPISDFVKQVAASLRVEPDKKLYYRVYEVAVKLGRVPTERFGKNRFVFPPFYRPFRVSEEIALRGGRVSKEDLYKIFERYGVTNRFSMLAHIRNWISSGKLKRVEHNGQVYYELPGVGNSSTTAPPAPVEQRCEPTQSLAAIRKILDAAETITRESTGVPPAVLSAVLNILGESLRHSTPDQVDATATTLNQIHEKLTETWMKLVSIENIVTNELYNLWDAMETMTRTADGNKQQISKIAGTLRNIEQAVSYAVENSNIARMEVDELGRRFGIRTYPSFSEFVEEALSSPGAVRHAVGVCTKGIIEIAYARTGEAPSEYRCRLIPIGEINESWTVHSTRPIAEGDPHDLDELVDDAVLAAFYADRQSVWFEPARVLKPRNPR